MPVRKAKTAIKTTSNTEKDYQPKRKIKSKSLSERLDGIGNSVHNIFHRHSKHSDSEEPKIKSNLKKSKPIRVLDTKERRSSLESETESSVEPELIFDAMESPSKENGQGHLILPNIEIHKADSSSESPPDAPKRKVFQKRDRSASMVWVDFLTQDGVSLKNPLKDQVQDENKNENFASRPCSVANGRKAWFVDAEDSTGNNTEEEEKERASSVHSKYKRYPRKDSCPPSIKSVKQNRHTITPEPDQAQPHRNVDDLIFDMFQDKDEEVVLVGTFLAALEKTGLRRSDPRLVELFENLKKVHTQQEIEFPKRNVGSIETLRLDRGTFKNVITDNIVLISKAFRQQFIIPEFQQFCKHIEDIFMNCKTVSGGKVAAYIPQLARVDPNYWGVTICSIDGQRYSIGETTVPFTLQSCSKPLTYAIALNELGSETVHQYVGQEPSGRMFNELVLDYNKKPHNPMVNAGAIIVCSLLKTMVRPEMTLAEKFDYTLQYFKRMGGGDYVGFNNAVFLSERECADRNYALGFYMREHKCFPEGTNLKECLDYYFQCCSMETNCETASVMAATLANGGICPVSGEKVLKSDSVRDVLSLMHSCGMYDYSGQFAFKVGLPAKSGVSGSIILVVPNVLGMCIWSPPLDVLGNTFRGVQFCQQLVEVFNFHKYDNLRHASHKLDPRRHRYETKGLNIVNLLFSAASGDVTSMRRHHLSGMDMSAGDYDGRTALHLAAAEGHLECVEYLLRHCHVNHKPLDRWGHLPLDDADRFGHEDVAVFLRQWDKEHESI